MPSAFDWHHQTWFLVASVTNIMFPFDYVSPSEVSAF